MAFRRVRRRRYRRPKFRKKRYKSRPKRGRVVRGAGRTRKSKRPPKGVGPAFIARTLQCHFQAGLRNDVSYVTYSIGSPTQLTAMMSYYNQKYVTGGGAWAHGGNNTYTGWTTITNGPDTLGASNDVWEGFKFYLESYVLVLKLKNNEDIPVDVSCMWSQAKLDGLNAYADYWSNTRKDSINFENTNTVTSLTQHYELMYGMNAIAKMPGFKKHHKVLRIKGKRLYPGDEWTVTMKLGPMWIHRDILVQAANHSFDTLKNKSAGITVRTQGVLGFHDGAGTVPTGTAAERIDQDCAAYTPSRIIIDRRLFYKVRFPQFTQLPRKVVEANRSNTASASMTAAEQIKFNDNEANAMVVAGGRDATLEAPNL